MTIMKKVICGVLSVVVVLLVSGWSGEISNADTGDAESYYPELYLSYSVDGELHFEKAKAYPQSWTTTTDEGLFMTAISCYTSEIPGAEDLPNIELSSNTTEIKMMFTLQPSSYTVRRFDNSASDEFDNNSKIEVTDNTITLEDDGNQYRYRVVVQWDDRGSVIYWFSVN